jgi:hypothetical protein
MNWLYKGQFIEDIPEIETKPYGFIYIITEISTNKKYIGKKLFTKAAYKTTKGKKKKIRKESNWKNYWSSSPSLLAEIQKKGIESFTKEIVKLCYSRSECSYYETKLIFETDAIISHNYYNDWVSCKISRKHVKNLNFDNKK